MLKILLQYSGAQKGSLLIGGMEISSDILDSTMKVLVGPEEDVTWTRIPKSLVGFARKYNEPVLIGNFKFCV
jgi:hypothetical protein